MALKATKMTLSERLSMKNSSAESSGSRIDSEWILCSCCTSISSQWFHLFTETAKKWRSQSEPTVLEMLLAWAAAPWYRDTTGYQEITKPSAILASFIKTKRVKYLQSLQRCNASQPTTFPSKVQFENPKVPIVHDSSSFDEFPSPRRIFSSRIGLNVHRGDASGSSQVETDQRAKRFVMQCFFGVPTG